MNPELEAFLKGLPEGPFHKTRFKHWPEYLGTQFFNATFGALPWPWYRRFARAFSKLACALPLRRLRETETNIRLALGVNEREARRILRGACANFLGNWQSMIRLPENHTTALAAFAEVRGLAHLELLEKNGQGVVIVSPHLGHWEVTPVLAGLSGYPCASLATAQHNPIVDRWITRLRSRGGGRVIHNRHGMKSALRILRMGGRIGLLPDFDPGRRGVFLPFLGRPASTLTGPAELILRGRAALIFARCQVSDLNRPRLIMELSPPEDLSRFTALPHDEAALAISKHINDRISTIIRANPEQWFWLQRRWKTQPAD